MKQSPALVAYAVLVPLAVAFVLLSGDALPPVVAAHFGVTGAADGFMPRTAYLTFILAVALGVTLVFVLAPLLLAFVPTGLVNLPNRDYWLAPERRAATLRFLRNHAQWLATLLLVFLCFVHWLVVEANALRPPKLASSWLIIGLVLLTAGTIGWLGALLVHFRRTGA
jgi:uncharacterized membrane protein